MSNKRLTKRKCEMWISNNKVLVGSNKKHARNPNFETEETRLLISLWGDPKVQKTLITTHKKHPVIMKLAEQMREHGYFRSADEINTRIKNLKCFYNRIKKDVEIGAITDPTWKHFAAMDEIVTRPVFGNRVQQPHLQHLLQAAGTATASAASPAADQQQQQQQKQIVVQKAAPAGGTDASDLESTDGLRPEDLLSVKGDEDADVDFEDGDLLPKDEPVDVDDMANHSDMDDVNDIFPKLSQYLQLAAAASAASGHANGPASTASKALLKLAAADVLDAKPRTPIQIPSPTPMDVVDIKSSPPSSPRPADAHTPPSSRSPTAQLLSALALTPAILGGSATATTPAAAPATENETTTTTSAATAASASAQHQSKISLVPTNILMKPKVAATAVTTATGTTSAPAVALPLTAVPSTMAINPHQPQSITFGGENYVCANTVSNGKSVYTSQQKDGQPMKVLLVNTIQKPASQVTVPAGNMIIASSSQAAHATAMQTSTATTVSAAPPTLYNSTIAHPVSSSSSSSIVGGCGTRSTSGFINTGAASNTVVTLPASTKMVVCSSAATAASAAITAKTKSSLIGSGMPAPIYTTRSARAHAAASQKLSACAGSSAAGSAALVSAVAELENAAAVQAAVTETLAACAAADTSAVAVTRRSAARVAATAAAATASGPDSPSSTLGPMRAGRRTAPPTPSAYKIGARGAQSAGGGFRALLQHLIALQTDTLDTSKQRLELERQRLDFEQTMGRKLLSVLGELVGARKAE